MRYRALDTAGDMTFGSGGQNFLVNSPECVAQAVKTRLLLITGEWLLDVTEGTPYRTQVLGTGTNATYDQAIRTRILGTPGVLALVSYSSSVTGRALTVAATVKTAYGQADVATVL